MTDKEFFFKKCIAELEYVDFKNIAYNKLLYN